MFKNIPLCLYQNNLNNLLKNKLFFSLNLVAVFLLPLFIKAVFSLPRLMLQNFTDGVFYLGYAMHFGELVDRVGLNYYAVRFGAIFPDALAFSIFGPVAGFSLVRYGLAGIACVVLYLAFSKHFDSILSGWFAVFCFGFNAAAIRLLQTGYVDVAGSFFLVIGVGLVIIGRTFGWKDFVAGICFGLAFWSHLHAGFALFFLLPLLVCLRLGGCKVLCNSIGLWILGGALVTICGVLFYGINYNLWDITSPTREYMRLLTEEGLAARWRAPWGNVLKSNTFWFVPIPILFAMLALRSVSRDALGAFFALAGFVSFLVYGDLFRGGFSLSMFYYFSFAVAGLVVCQSAIAGKEIKERPAMFFAFVTSGVLPALSIKYLPGEWFWTVIGPLIVVISYVFGYVFSGKRWTSAVAVAMFALAVSLVSGADSSRLALGNYWKKDDIGLLAIGEKLSNSLPCYKDDSSDLVFWYPNKDGTDSKMIQSLYLHNFTLFQNDSSDFIPFSALDAKAVETVSKSGIRHVVIIDADPNIIQQGVKWLKEAGIELEEVRIFTISEKKDTLHVGHAILKRCGPTWDHSLPIDLVEVQKRASAAILSDGIKIITAPIKWNFDAFLKIPKHHQEKSLKLSFEVNKGQIYVGLFRTQQPDGQICATKFAAKSGEIITIFSSAVSKDAEYIGIRNAAPNGVRSEWILRKIELCDESCNGTEASVRAHAEY